MLYYGDEFTLNFSEVINLDGAKKIDDNKKSITIIGFYKILVKYIKVEADVYIISPNVIFADGSIVNLSSTVIPKDRPPEKKGLPGLPGTSGHNLNIVSTVCNADNVVFISEGTKGGKPDGADGKQGLLLVNSTNVDINIYKQIAYIGINNRKNSLELTSLFKL